MKGKSGLMAGVAAIALIASAQAADAKKHHTSDADTASSSSSTSSESTSGPSNAELAARLKAVEDALAADEAKEESSHTRLSTLEQNFNDTSWSFDNARPTVKSGDGRFTMAFRVRFQADWANFMQDTTHAPAPPPTNVAWGGKGDLSSGAVIRRAYFGVEGRAFKDFFYELRLNGGGSDGGNNNAGEGDPLVNKAVITYTGIDHFHINVGIIEPNFMFEGTTSSAWLTFMERPEIDNIAADSFGAGDSRRGVEMNWQKTDTLWPGDNVNVSVAYTGAKTGSTAGHGNSGDEQSQLLGRVSERLWTDGINNIQVGGSWANDFYSGGSSAGPLGFQLRDRPEIRVDGTRLIDTGGIAAKHAFMWAVDAGMNYDSFFLGGEYSHFQVDRLASGLKASDHPDFSGWYVEGSWFLTGETRSYEASALNNEVAGWDGPVAIASPFSFDGDSWGAWELGVRYSNTDLNWMKTYTGSSSTQAGITGGDEAVVDIALNWYLNKNIRLMMDDMIVHLSKQSAAGIVGTTASVAPQGQDLNIVGVRLQFAN